MQRIANPCTRVRFTYTPPPLYMILIGLKGNILGPDHYMDSKYGPTWLRLFMIVNTKVYRIFCCLS
jgi:hypothetical protein